MAKYLKLPNGTVHSVTDEDWDKYHSVEVDGKRYPLQPGVQEITEAAARKAHPALFGAPDPRVVEALSMKEIAEARAKAKYVEELLKPPGEEPEPAADTDPQS